ncbi:hypothetical protein CPB84DRAFT_1677194, partial [Gymnopilus junonius]
NSTFKSLLVSNAAPSEEQIRKITTYLAGPEVELSVLDAELERLRFRFTTLLSRQDKLWENVYAHLSPIHRLPLEVLEEIFILCLPTHRNCVMSSDELPLRLGHICNFWQRVAYSLPCL